MPAPLPWDLLETDPPRLEREGRKREMTQRLSARAVRARRPVHPLRKAHEAFSKLVNDSLQALQAAMSRFELPRGLRISRASAQYAQDILKCGNGLIQSLDFPNVLSLGSASELHKLVDRYLEAWNNPGMDKIHD